MTSSESAPSNTDALSTEETKPRYWRSLAELNQQEEFQDYLHREFPVAASEFPEGVSRRRWMQLMGASFALAGVAGCRYPEETIEPFVLRPEGRVPGETYSRATNIELAGRVYSLLVTCFDGRPIKIEPNTDHPSGGGTDAYSQASILGLYDPDRSRGKRGFLIRKGEKRRVATDWPEFESFGAAWLKTAVSHNNGSGFAVLMDPTSSPSTLRMLAKLKERLPNATICRYDSVGDDVMRDATSQVFGKAAKEVLKLDDAEIILTLQSDILGQHRNSVSNSAGFAKHRDAVAGDMSRLYVVEGGFTLTGSMADSRLALRPSEMPAFLAELGRRVEALVGGEKHNHDDEAIPYDKLPPEDRLERFLDVLAHDFAEHGDKAVVVVGEHLGAEAVAAGIRFNEKIGSLGKLQTFVTENDKSLGDTVSLGELVGNINNGAVDSLLVLGGNPVVTAPGDIDVATAISKVEHSVYLGEYDDETALVSEWSLPLAHPLESWSDCVDDNGHYGVCQPNILPLMGGRTSAEVLAVVLGEAKQDSASIVRATADEVAGGKLGQHQWRSLLHDGYSKEITVESETLAVQGEAKELTGAAPKTGGELDRDDFEVIFVPADGLYDGRFANNGWLQEMPQSLTKMTWDNAAVIAPATAKALGVKHGLKIGLVNGDVRIDLPVYEMPGCAPGVVTVAIGYGRKRVGMVGGMPEKDVDVVGFDVSPIRTSDSMHVAKVAARPMFEQYGVATTQDHWAIDDLGKDENQSRSFSLVREGTTELMKKVPEFANGSPKAPHVPSVGAHGSPWHEPMQVIQAEEKEAGSNVPQWGMAIDLSKCFGCNGCVIACQSENNVPIVGREQVLNSREMHWLRIDRYFQGDENNAEIVQEPMMCQHCETAPCEQVCPVAATVHTNEGINAMAYNRCIGTRYCANNCPFKVRRFNYFNYNEEVGVGYGVKAYPGAIEKANRKLQSLVLNPDVTVRGRGVMEKCTYCVQRVEQAKINARKDGGRAIRDGDVVTACQAACPTNAIEFGNLADPESAVSKKHADVRAYGMLSQLNLKPRTEYLARVRNPHKRLMTSFQLDDLKKVKAPHHHDHGDHGDGDHGHNDEHGHDGGHGHDDGHADKEQDAKH